jgi:polyisoprenoid-binding protein YceI
MLRSLFALALAAGIASAADQKIALTGENTAVTFTGTKKGGKHDGGFKKLIGTATIPDGDLTKLAIEATIDADSLYSDNEKLTAHLKNPDFFGVKDNPTATFKSTKVEKTEKGYTVTGDLTLLGKTKPVTLPSTIELKDGKLVLTSEFKIKRFDWGMTFGKGMVDDEVSLKLKIDSKRT